MCVWGERCLTTECIKCMVCCCILSWQIKGNTVPISAICNMSSLELCHLDTGIVWLKLPKAHPPPNTVIVTSGFH